MEGFPNDVFPSLLCLLLIQHMSGICLYLFQVSLKNLKIWKRFKKNHQNFAIILRKLTIELQNFSVKENLAILSLMLLEFRTIFAIILRNIGEI